MEIVGGSSYSAGSFNPRRATATGLSNGTYSYRLIMTNFCGGVQTYSGYSFSLP
jgi:hypothetical protein